MQELTIRQQEKARPQEKAQTSTQGSEKYTDTRPSVIKKELVKGQLYQMQELTTRQQEKARLQEKAQTSTQTPSQV